MPKQKDSLVTNNYRICFRPSVPGYGYQIHEVFYNTKKQIIFYTQQPVSVQGDDLLELYEDITKMWRAIEGEEPLDLDRLDKKFELHNDKTGE